MSNRTRLVFALMFLLGCNQRSAADPLQSQTAQPATTAGATLPPDLGTRKSGVDWPVFLGPTGDSRSTETGILAPWPKDGPKIVWQQPLGTS